MPVRVHIGANDRSRHGHHRASSVDGDVRDDRCVRTMLALRSLERCRETITVLLTREHGIDLDADHAAAEERNEAPMGGRIGVIRRNLARRPFLTMHHERFGGDDEAARPRKPRGQPARSALGLTTGQLRPRVADDHHLVAQGECAFDNQLVSEMERRELADDDAAAKTRLAQGSAPATSDVYCTTLPPKSRTRSISSCWSAPKRASRASLTSVASPADSSNRRRSPPSALWCSTN